MTIKLEEALTQDNVGQQETEALLQNFEDVNVKYERFSSAVTEFKTELENQGVAQGVVQALDTALENMCSTLDMIAGRTGETNTE